MGRSVKKTLDLLFFAYHGLVGVLLGILFLVLGNATFSGVAAVRELLNSMGSTFVVGSLFGLLYTNISRNIYYEDLRYLIEREESGFRRVFPQSNDPEVVAEISSQLKYAKEVKMYGIAINLLWKPEVIRTLREAAKNGQTRVKILVADVSSPQVQQRISEEEDYPFPHTHGKEIIENVVARLKKIEAEVGETEFFDVRLFSHYPTFGLIIVDDDVYCYPYGYKTIGTVGPMVHLTGYRSPQVRYYREQFEVLLRNYPRN